MANLDFTETPDLMETSNSSDESLVKDLSQVFKGFSKLTKDQRLEALVKAGLLAKSDLNFLARGGLRDTSLGEKFIENVIGYFQIPLGIATNFCIDNQDYVIPMAVEETSIVAAASKTNECLTRFPLARKCSTLVKPTV